MNFPQFWAKGESGNLSVWRWSFQSIAEAQSLANQAAQELAARFRDGNFPGQRGGYYPTRPFREQVLQEIKSDSGETRAVVTRNSYGCQVLNTAGVMFVDIDLPEPRRAGFFQKLFGKPTVSAPSREQDGAVQRVEAWTRQNSDWGWRIYRTRSGLRLMATQALVEPDSALTEQVFEALGADRLYQQLCKTQKCFRARLTPKPWRCGIHRKPERWPWADAQKRMRFEKWEAQYQSYAAGWATCQFLRHIGNPAVHEEVQSILRLHDWQTRAESKLNLA